MSTLASFRRLFFVMMAAVSLTAAPLSSAETTAQSSGELAIPFLAPQAPTQTPSSTVYVDQPYAVDYTTPGYVDTYGVWGGGWYGDGWNHSGYHHNNDLNHHHWNHNGWHRGDHANHANHANHAHHAQHAHHGGGHHGGGHHGGGHHK